MNQAIAEGLSTKIRAVIVFRGGQVYCTRWAEIDNGYSSPHRNPLPENPAFRVCESPLVMKILGGGFQCPERVAGSSRSFS
jgi:hypothetical protein